MSQTTDVHIDWIRQFVERLQRHLLEASHALPSDADDSEIQEATARAVLATYLDSGVELETAVESLGQAAIEAGSPTVAWNETLNHRRFALIDKDIQGTLTPAESVELAGLTRIMRREIDSEANLPTTGARALHRKLLELEPVGRGT